MNFVVKTCNIYRFFTQHHTGLIWRSISSMYSYCSTCWRLVRKILRQMSQHSHLFALHQITVGHGDRRLDRRMTNVTKYVIAIDCSSQWRIWEGVWGTTAPIGPIFSDFMQFLGEDGQNNRFASSPPLACRLPLRNPRSTTVSHGWLVWQRKAGVLDTQCLFFVKITPEEKQ